MNLLLDVLNVRTKDDYLLELEFENGERRVFDLKPWLQRPPFHRLRAVPLFRCATVRYGTVSWPGNIDLAPETLWLRSVPLP